MFLLVANQVPTVPRYFLLDFRMNVLQLFDVNHTSVRMVPPNVNGEHDNYFLFS